MATGGSEGDPDLCPVCRDSFQTPKFLPCYHTFCSRCIQGVAYLHPGGRFPCPCCRRPTSLPPGGVSDLQNFYIKVQTPHKKPGAQDMCKTHDDKKLKFYCVKCDEVICINCKMTRHERHETDDLTSAVFLKKKNLQADQQRLERALNDIQNGVTSLEEEKQSLDKKREAVAESIRDRRDTVVAVADQKMKEELETLQSMCTNLNGDLVRATDQQNGHKTQVSDLLQLLNNAITSGTASDVISVAKEMKSGRGSQRAVNALASREERPVRRPVLHFSVSTDVLTQTTRDYVGRVSPMEMEETRPEVRVTERFRCGQGPAVEVFSLCYCDYDPPNVFVSYERCRMKEDAPMKQFTETGKCVFTGTGDKVGKLSYRRHAEGQCMFPSPQLGRFTTHCKSPTAAHLELTNKLSGQAHMERVTVTSTDPFKTETKIEFTIQMGLHRAFDVDDTERYFAVVEEADTESSTPRRNVRLYHRTEDNVTCSQYTPPAADYLPSDVCFYSLGGQTVLLITDQLNDSIHVTITQGTELRFKRYLCAGCPSLIQPTAITVDTKGRLWVACRGGAILTLEPIV